MLDITPKDITKALRSILTDSDEKLSTEVNHIQAIAESVEGLASALSLFRGNPIPIFGLGLHIGYKLAMMEKERGE